MMASSFTKNIPISKMREGLIPAKTIMKQGKKYWLKETRPGIFTTSVSVGPRPLFLPRPEGISAEDISKLRKIPASANILTLPIHETLPFAPFMFLGVILQMLFLGNIFSYIVSLL